MYMIQKRFRGTMEYLKLPTLTGCLEMPILGFGTWQVSDANVIKAALHAGYPLIDTAISYGNEAIIGHVLQERIGQGKMKEGDVFIASKMPGVYMGSKEYVKKAVERSLRDLNVDTIDLYSMHGPCGMQYKDELDLFPHSEKGKPRLANHNIITAWKALEECVEDGFIKAIGVSNFNADQMSRIQQVARVPVANNQVEVHAYFSQKDVCSYCKDMDITVTAFAPLGSPGRLPFAGQPVDPMSDPVIKDIGKKYSKTPAQVLLKNLVQREIAIIPKSSTHARIEENSKIFDFTLSSCDMERVANLDQNKRTFTIEMWREHPEYPF